MSNVAKILLEFGSSKGIHDENKLCKAWAKLPSIHDDSGPHLEVQKILNVKGVGPALLEYLRMLCGANTIKIDVRVTKGLSEAGVPVHLFNDAGLYEICRSTASELGLTMVELDQLLWIQ